MFRKDRDIRFGDLSREYSDLRQEIDEAVGRVLASGWFVLGPEVESFENEFAEWLGSDHCVGVASGTEAIALALMACGVSRGDEVVTVSLTAVPTVTAIRMLGAVPVFADCVEDTCLMDVDHAKSLCGPKTRAIVPVHLYGQCVDMDPLLEVTERTGIPVIEDCAQAHGARYKGRLAGTMGVTGCFSFYPSKNLGCYGDGGAVVTGDADIAEKLASLRNYGQAERYTHTMEGINSRLDEIQAAILRAKLGKLAAWNERRRTIAGIYGSELGSVPLDLPVEADGNHHVYHLYVVKHSERDKLMSRLKDAGVQTLIHYPIPVHLQVAFSGLGVEPGSLPVTERLANSVMSFPMYPYLSDAEAETVAEQVRRCVG